MLVCPHISLNTFEQIKRIMGKPCLCVPWLQHIRTKYSKLVYTESSESFERFGLNFTSVRLVTKVTTNLESHLFDLKHNNKVPYMASIKQTA